MLHVPTPDHSRRPSREDVEAVRHAFKQAPFTRVRNNNVPLEVNSFCELPKCDVIGHEGFKPVLFQVSQDARAFSGL